MLGCTVRELGARLPAAEYVEWIAWLTLDPSADGDPANNPDYEFAQMRRVLN